MNPALLRQSISRAARAIRKRQALWVQHRGLQLDASGRWLDPTQESQYLIAPMPPHVRSAFSGGRPDGLGRKMLAPHSSAALVYNMFAHATPTVLQALASALSLEQPSTDSTTATLDFAVRRPTPWTQVFAGLDAEVQWPDTLTIAVESKFGESFTGSRNTHKALIPLKVQKWDRSSARWSGMTRVYDMARALFFKKTSYELLDAPQLIKQMLGLRMAQQHGALPAHTLLVWLWYDIGEHAPKAQPACDLLRKEFHDFATRIGSDFDLRMLTHQSLFRAYQHHVGEADWLAWLEKRYFS